MLGCGGVGVGAPCVDDLDCQTSLVCIADPALAEASCMRACDDATRICDDGTVCTAFVGGRACYPGGEVGYGEPCQSNLDCESGTVCPDEVRACSQACEGALPVCLLTEQCFPNASVGAYCGVAVTP